MATREWHLDDAARHVVRLEHGYWSGRVRITLDGVEIAGGDFRLTYQFRSPSGRELEGQVSGSRPELARTGTWGLYAGIDAPPPGTPVWVLYGDDQNHVAL